MKHTPIFLASLFVTLSIYRVGIFIQDVLAGGWLAWIFALALAASVFVSGYFFRFKETRLAAIVSLIIFLPSDLFLNILELVRTTSAAQLVADGSHFLGVDAAYLTYWMQYGALLFGGLQTFAAAVLGWMSAGSEKIQLLRARAFMPRLGKQIMAGIDSLFPAEKSPVKTYASTANGGKSEIKRGEEVRRNELRAADKDKISAMTTRQIIATFGGSARRAREWKEAAEKGEL